MNNLVTFIWADDQETEVATCDTHPLSTQLGRCWCAVSTSARDAGKGPTHPIPLVATSVLRSGLYISTEQPHFPASDTEMKGDFQLLVVREIQGWKLASVFMRRTLTEEWGFCYSLSWWLTGDTHRFGLNPSSATKQLCYTGQVGTCPLFPSSPFQ